MEGLDDKVKVSQNAKQRWKILHQRMQVTTKSTIQSTEIWNWMRREKIIKEMIQ